MTNGHVLVVEDDDTIRRLLVEYLATDGRRDVDSARDGVEALHCIATRDYAMVILDLMMPKMSGIDFLNSLVAMTSDPSVKSLASPPAVVIVTGAPDVPAGELEQRYATLVRAVFRKPVDVERLTKRVDELLKV